MEFFDSSGKRRASFRQIGEVLLSRQKALIPLRASEILALRWSDIQWNEERIRVSKRWAKGKDGDTKTESS